MVCLLLLGVWFVLFGSFSEFCFVFVLYSNKADEVVLRAGFFSSLEISESFPNNFYTLLYILMDIMD